MGQRVPFEAFLVVMRIFGWDFYAIWKPYRVFVRPGSTPIVVRVDDEGFIDKNDVIALWPYIP